jgi:molybdopterin molybdotransferase
MDGYAVRCADVTDEPATLSIIGESAAGQGFEGAVGTGEAVRIFTGAPVPQGADTIIIQENAERTDDALIVKEVGVPGRWIRRAGLDFKTGDVLLKAGRFLTWRDVGLAAAMNVPEVTVRRKPVIACLATGNELTTPGQPVGPNAIVNSNAFAFCAAVRSFGGEPVDLGIVRDSVDAFLAAVRGAQDADLLVTFGGASVGSYDIVRRAFEGPEFDLDFYKIAMRPGKPLIFGRYGSLPVLGLPGNPVSVAVTTVLFVRDAIHALLGLPKSPLPVTPAFLDHDLAANDIREEYMRGRLRQDETGAFYASAFSKQDSSMMATLAAADCLIIRPANAPAARAGDPIRVIQLQEFDTMKPAKIV